MSEITMNTIEIGFKLFLLVICLAAIAFVLTQFLSALVKKPSSKEISCVKDFEIGEHCNFCNLPKEMTELLISSVNNTYICDGCIDLCAEILEAKRKGTSK